ncbi:unnamed protein product [Colias eurytheme]|nr:unnamed protein product [Colias eurytheme]
MQPKSCVVRGTLALVLRMMRPLALAPISITTERDGYRIRVSRFYAVLGWFFYTLLNILIVLGIILHEIWEDESIPITTVTKKSSVNGYVWIINFIALSIYIGYGYYTNLKRIKIMIQQIIIIDKIKLTIRKKKNDDEKKFIAAAVLLFLLRICIDIHATNSSFQIHGLYSISFYSYSCLHFLHIGICLLHIQMFALYVELLPILQCVQDDLEALANMKPNGKGFTSGVSTLFHFLTFLYHILSMMLIIEPFVRIDEKIVEINLILGELMTDETLNLEHYPELDILHMELCEYDFTYQPMGLITMHRSLIAQVQFDNEREQFCGKQGDGAWAMVSQDGWDGTGQTYTDTGWISS